MDWSTHYPAFVSREQDMKVGLPSRMSKEVEVADVGCGFGGLLIALAPLLPETLMIGLSLAVLSEPHIRWTSPKPHS